MSRKTRVLLVTLREFAQEPRPRHVPVARDRGVPDAQDFGGLFDREAAEVAKLDDACLARVEACEFLECLVERNDLRLLPRGRLRRLIERDLARGATALLAAAPPRVVNQDAAHCLRGDAEEVCPVLPLDVFVPDEPQVGLVD